MQREASAGREPLSPLGAWVAGGPLLDMAGADDQAVWSHARDKGFVIVTKDDDFLDLAAHHGPPPVVIWLRLGNCDNARVLSVLHEQQAEIAQRVNAGKVGVIELG